MIKNIVIGVLVLIVALLSYSNQSVRSFLGGPTPTGQAHTQLETFQQGLIVGNGTGSGANKGTAYQLIRSGTCSLQANASITATTTKQYSCTGSDLTGYVGTSRDIVRVALAASTTLASQYLVKYAFGTTTTSASLEVGLLNLTGVSAVPAATNGFGSSTQFQIFRPYP